MRRLLLLCLLIKISNGFAWVFNDPYPAKETKQKIYYSSFTEQPKTLDPAKSYSLNEYLFVRQIYEPILQYDYLARPYRLIPLTAESMPSVTYYNAAGQVIRPDLGENVDHTVYTIHLKKGILYQPHPGFVSDYYPLPMDFVAKHGIHDISDFKRTSTRELLADDYIYEIKRLANPRVTSAIYGLMSQYIIGFSDYSKTLPQTHDHDFIDLRQYPLEGVNKIDDYTFEISIKGSYPQFIFWLSMPFFSPIPWEVDRFYSQPALSKQNLNFGWYPVGTGAFMLTENNPNSRMVLDKNPNYRAVYFPKTGSVYDQEHGFLKHAGERLPMIDRAIYTLEKESIPRWSKFLQGYYDLSGISADSFDQAISVDKQGTAHVSPTLQAKGIYLEKTSEPAIYYIGFNMLDPVVGGYGKRARKLRQAISIAVNYDEYIAIFLNERGLAAQSPLPRGIFGHRTGQAGINPVVYYWNKTKPKRRSLAYAKRLMREAGYPNGRNVKTGHPLVLHYDVTATGGPEDKAEFDWMRKQYAKLGISLDVRATQYNRFQEKMRTGNAQIFKWGWSADYPDPENFLFILYGPNGKVRYGGENASNYKNPRYDRLFDAMKNRANDATRQSLIDQMLSILRRDAPWIWGVNSELFTLSQPWVSPIKANPIAGDTLKYVFIDVEMRTRLRHQWNQAVVWPVMAIIVILFGIMIPFIFAYRRRQNNRATRVIRNHHAH